MEKMRKVEIWRRWENMNTKGRGNKPGRRLTPEL